MSIVKFGSVIVGARGTAGGLTYSLNKSGPYVKGWARGSNATRPLQSVSRSTLATISALWRTIGSTLQAAWDVWAADAAQVRVNSLGEDYYLSGFQAFVGVNVNRATVARAVSTAVPTLTQPAAPSGLGATISAGAVADVLTYAALTFGPDYDCVIEVVLANGEGSVVSPGGWRVLCGVQIPGGTSLTLTTYMTTRCGVQRVGQVAFLRVYKQNLEGYRSAAGSLRISVVA
jgi:hypothetical protein